MVAAQGRGPALRRAPIVREKLRRGHRAGS